MTFERWSYEFDGAYTSPDRLRSELGVYVIWCKDRDKWTVLDVGESDNVKDRVSDHDRADCWAEHCTGTIYYSAHYMPLSDEDERRRVEQEIRKLTNPPCGER
jgi:hypothetical protein